MAPFRGIRRVAQWFGRRRTLEREVAEEVAFHLEMREAELVQLGRSPDEAREEARREFGDAAAARAELARIDRLIAARRDRAAWLEEAWSDLRLAVRQLRRQPRFLAATVLVLALGIGAVLTRRLPFLFIGAFAGLAVILAVVGVYGVVAYHVADHRRELGVRIALGATRSQVVGLVLRQGAMLAGGGLVVGVVLALALGRALRKLLYQVAPADPATIALVAVGLGLTTLAGCWIPARRAARLDPATTLRE